jgi:D-arabinose 1-dehydrogenase-like Zn-dependent alcohol dehydrogenase
VLGHEGVGIIEATGPDVKYMKKGDRVGWGYVHDTCGHCEMCLTGREQYCLQRQMYGEANLDQGSFAHKAVWKESFLFPIPDGLSDEAAAPLQCGGATVFNALFSNGIKPTETVGIMGVGGLGQSCTSRKCVVSITSLTKEISQATWPFNSHPRWAATLSCSPDPTERRTRQ